MIDVSVVIATHDQIGRLRLVLQGLKVQTLVRERFEVIVVDDGCTDGTAAELLSHPCSWLRVLQAPGHVGRCAARNLGAAAAGGRLVVFLDGDALPSPTLLSTYWDAYQQHGENAVLCGRQRVLPGLDYLDDPQDARSAVRHAPSVVADWAAAHAAGLVVREEDVLAGSRDLLKRSYLGGYPFPDAAEKQRQTRELLASGRGPGGLEWVGFVPHNGAIPRRLWRAAGGFDTAIPFSEGWELAYRLVNGFGAAVVATDADTLHLYHHHRFLDAQGARAEAIVRYRAVEYMARKHHDQRIRLLYLWFASLWPDPFIPDDAVVSDLLSCDAAYRAWDVAQQRECAAIVSHHPVIGHLAAA